MNLKEGYVYEKDIGLVLIPKDDKFLILSNKWKNSLSYQILKGQIRLHIE